MFVNLRWNPSSYQLLTFAGIFRVMVMMVMVLDMTMITLMPTGRRSMVFLRRFRGSDHHPGIPMRRYRRLVVLVAVATRWIRNWTRSWNSMGWQRRRYVRCRSLLISTKMKQRDKHNCASVNYFFFLSTRKYEEIILSGTTQRGQKFTRFAELRWPSRLRYCEFSPSSLWLVYWPNFAVLCFFCSKSSYRSVLSSPTIQLVSLPLAILYDLDCRNSCRFPLLPDPPLPRQPMDYSSLEPIQ